MTTFVIHEKGSPMKKKTLIMLLTSILCIALLPAVAHAATRTFGTAALPRALRAAERARTTRFSYLRAQSLSCWRITLVRRGSAAAT